MKTEENLDSGLSDEGYNSSPIKMLKQNSQSDDQRNSDRIISRSTKDFKAKYFIEKVVINSANGVIYQGEYIW